MSYTKEIALYDKITVDGEDVSNLFKSIAPDITDAEVDVSGFSVTGADETLQGNRTSTLTADIFYTPEGHAILYPLFRDRVTFEVTWQPDGLIDPTREVWHGNVKMFGYNPSATRGDARVMSGVAFKAADADGIVADAAT